jgi:hypothetical protein
LLVTCVGWCWCWGEAFVDSQKLKIAWMIWYYSKYVYGFSIQNNIYIYISI